MLLDQSLLFSDQQNLASAGPDGSLLIAGTNVVDLSVRRDVLDGDDLFVQFRVTTAFVAGAGAPGLQLGISTADNAAMSSNLVTHLLTGGPSITTYMVASALPLNAEVYVPLPRLSSSVSGISSLTAEGVPGFVQRYLGVSYWQTNFSGNYFSAGKITARIVRAPHKYRNYPNAI